MIVLLLIFSLLGQTLMVIDPLPPLLPPPDPCENPARASDKIDDALEAAMVDPERRLPIVVEMRSTRDRHSAAAAEDAGGLIQRCGGTFIGGLALIASGAGIANSKAIDFISSRPNVAFVHADHMILPSSGPYAPAASDFPPGQLTSAYPRAVRADAVWQQGVRGAGVTVAVLDSGVADDVDLGARLKERSPSFAGTRTMPDPGGHGTHVATIIAGSGARSAGQYVGIAPHASIVDVPVLNGNGVGRVSSVVRGIEWSLANRERLGIRVLNMSFSAPPNTSCQGRTCTYRDDPLAAAVEIAWRRGVVTVVASGNRGAGKVGTPGIDPYAITVGALDDRGTSHPSDDVFPSFSGWGTPEGSGAKPDLVAPGRQIVAALVPGSALGQYAGRVVTAKNGSKYLRLTGTSMATPVVSGAVALLLSRHPSLRPDQVKAILTGTTQVYGEDSKAAPPPAAIADGAGLLDAYRASISTIRTEANRGLRPADTFCRALYPVLYGQPVLTKDGEQFDWDSVAWDSVAWDSVAWDSVAWDSVAWDSVAWDSVAWDSVAWDSVAWDNSVAWDSWGGGALD